MLSKWKSALASVAVLAAFAVPAQANTLAHWALDEGSSNGEEVTDLVGVDETGTYPGTYMGGLFGGAESATGITGVPSTAVDFGTAGYLEIFAEWDPNDPNDTGGIASRHADHFQIEYFINWNGNPTGQAYSENISGVGGPVLMTQFGHTPSSPTDLDFLVSPWIVEAYPLITPSVEPTGGFDAGEWYYISGQFKDPDWDDSNGTPVLIEAGVTELYVAENPLSGTPTVYSLSLVKGIDPSGTFARTDYLGGDTQGVERVIISGHGAGGGRTNAVIDEVKVFDQMFDPNSYLVSVLGIPEPSSVAVLGLGGLLLARRRQHL